MKDLVDTTQRNNCGEDIMWFFTQETSYMENANTLQMDTEYHQENTDQHGLVSDSF